MDFPTFLQRARGQNFVPPRIVVALDPGETTGYALFVAGRLQAVRQLKTKTVHAFTETFHSLGHFATLSPHEGQRPVASQRWKPFKQQCGKPSVVVYEDYRIYSWKTDHHAWASLHTPQCIGALKAIATINQLSLYTNLAQQPKGFCTDEKLEEWGYYKPNMRHARDAIRHGCYYLLHNFKPDSNPTFAAHGSGDPKHYNGNPA